MFRCLKSKFFSVFILLVVGAALSGCGTCIGCNGKFIDINAGEKYQKRVAEAKKAEEKACYDMGFRRGTSELLQCLGRFDQIRKERKEADLKKSRAIGDFFGTMGKAVRKSGQTQATPPAPAPPPTPRTLTCTKQVVKKPYP